MGNCLSNENSINGRTKARKSKADQRGAKIRLKRSKRRKSLENLSTLDNTGDENLASSAYASPTTPNPLSSRSVEVVATEASSNHPQVPVLDRFILGVGVEEQVQVERLQLKRKGGAPMVSCKPPSSTGAAPTSNAQSCHDESSDASHESFSPFSGVIALSDTPEANVDCPTAEIFSASASSSSGLASTSNGFTPPAILTLITAWLSGLGDNDFFFGIDPSPMPDLEVGGRAEAARPQVLSERTLALHMKSLALMNSSLPGSSAGAKQRHARGESEDEYNAGSSTDDFSSLENERLRLELSQEDLNSFEPALSPTLSNKSERSNKSGNTNGTVWPPGNQTPRKGSLLASFHARRRTEGASSQPYRAAQ